MIYKCLSCNQEFETPIDHYDWSVEQNTWTHNWGCPACQGRRLQVVDWKAYFNRLLKR